MPTREDIEELYLPTGRVITEEWYSKLTEVLHEFKDEIDGITPVISYGYIRGDIIPDLDLALNLGLKTLRFKQIHTGYGYFTYHLQSPIVKVLQEPTQSDEAIRKAELDSHRTTSPIDHPDASITRAKLVSPFEFTNLILETRTDDVVEEGRIFYRKDTQEVKVGTGTQAILAGARKLSQLEIDVDKDWGGHVIKNLGAPVDSADAIRKAELDSHKTASPIDHPDASITRAKLVSPFEFTNLILEKRTDDVIDEGRIFYRTDTHDVKVGTGTEAILAGARKLSQLEIDVDKDWGGHGIDNLGFLNSSSYRVGGTEVIDSARNLVGLNIIAQNLIQKKTYPEITIEETKAGTFWPQIFLKDPQRRWRIFLDGDGNLCISNYVNTTAYARYKALYSTATDSEQFEWYTSDGVKIMSIDYEGDLWIFGKLTERGCPEFKKMSFDELLDFIKRCVDKPEPPRDEKGRDLCEICGKPLDECGVIEHRRRHIEKYYHRTQEEVMALMHIVLNLCKRVEALERRLQTQTS